jgi:glycerophosphoryl diester phosphodiesterase
MDRHFSEDYVAPRIEPGYFAPLIAHRGLHDAARGALENSLLAFELAVEAGYGIELDIQPSVDDEPMVFHDATMERMTELDGPIAARFASDLRRIRLRDGGGARIPHLSDVLDLIAGRVPLYIEVKSWRRGPGRVDARIAELLAAYDGPVGVQSFDPLILAWFAEFAPAIRRGQIATQSTRASGGKLPWPERWHRAMLNYNAASRPDYIAYDVRGLPNPATRRARRHGLTVLAWTVRDAAAAGRARRHADNFLFEGFDPRAEVL